MPRIHVGRTQTTAGAPAVVLAIGAGLAHSSPAVIVIALGAVAFVAAASRMALAAKPA